MTHRTMLLHLAAAELSSGNAGRGWEERDRKPAWVVRKKNKNRRGKKRVAPTRMGPDPAVVLLPPSWSQSAADPNLTCHSYP
jgi:hypothetical protein